MHCWTFRLVYTFFQEDSNSLKDLSDEQLSEIIAGRFTTSQNLTVGKTFHKRLKNNSDSRALAGTRKVKRFTICFRSIQTEITVGQTAFCRPK